MSQEAEVVPNRENPIVRLQAMLKKAWVRERGRGMPRIHLEIGLGRHGDAADAEAFMRQFEACDVFIPESFGSNKRDVKIYQAVAETTFQL